MKCMFKPFFRMTAVIAAAVLLMGVFAQVRKASPDADDEGDKSEAVQMPSRVSVQNGETVLTLDPATQTRAGIVVCSVEKISSSAQVSAPATVLSAQDLVGLRNSYVAASAELEKARANADVARKEYERLKSLYEKEQNASQKDLESAEGAVRSDDVNVEAAGQALTLAADTVRQSWGDTVAGWVAGQTPELKRVLDQSDLLAQVTLPADQVQRAPHTLTLELPGPVEARATLVSAFPRVDPRIQGLTFLYVVGNHPGLAPGSMLTAHLAAGPSRSGVLVPEQGVVWWQGKAWVYQQTAADRFVRRALPTTTPVPSGFLVTKGFNPGEKIVFSGAQSLLSEEFRSQIQPED
jgi:membrane fusion protein, multidrug efflux system